jgi:hypothetical protein
MNYMEYSHGFFLVSTPFTDIPNVRNTPPRR